ncbi:MULTISPECIES: hypothetical protein, partial [unclassified Ruegeria]|uniref:hypothetical protein n=1 Tax=unclassified Ruegeria TaxID=2625375 RepID=UPI001C2C7A68
HAANIETTLVHRKFDGLRRASHLEDFFESYPLHRNRMLRWLGSTSALSGKASLLCRAASRLYYVSDAQKADFAKSG